MQAIGLFYSRFTYSPYYLSIRKLMANLGSFAEIVPILARLSNLLVSSDVFVLVLSYLV